MSKLLVDAKQRSRMVSFRASPEEYEHLRRISISKGARSVSEFARSVACQEPPGDGNGGDGEKMDTLLTGLNDTMSALDRNIQKLIETLETLDRPK